MKAPYLTGITALCALTVSGLCLGQSPLHPQPEFRALRPAHNPAPPRTRYQGNFGDPLPGLTALQLAAFATGKEEFEHVETPETGLGPIFNNVSCAACHSAGASGGASDLFVTRFGRWINGVFDPLPGGSLLQQFAIDPAVQEVIPAEANVVAHRVTTPLFGLGLIEAIPDETIRQLERRNKPGGIRGRVSTLVDITTGVTRVGRFGWKAQQATLLAFAGDAYLNEMGITSRFFTVENAPNGRTDVLTAHDHFADPEDELDPVTNKGDIDAAADFMRFLAPPPFLPLTPSARVGQAIFQQLGCAICHEPVLQTGRSPVAALDRKDVALYSDLLLHDMGSLGDGIEQGVAVGREMRTAPLWGLRARPALLHDGRTPSLDAAIRAHDGEALRSRENYRQLRPVQRQQLLEFLNSI